MSREQLIEDARQAGWDVWNRAGARVSGSRPPSWDAAISAALAVFEGAYTPTDDEQEALAQVVRRVIDAAYTFEGELDPAVDQILVRELVAAGFHRTVQGEPTPGKRLDPDFRADLIDAAHQRIRDVHVDVPEGVDDETLAQNVVAAQEFLWIARGFPVAKDPVQGEPLCLAEHPITGRRCSEPASPRHAHVCDLPPVQGEPRITIEHVGGNTVSGTPEQVLNHGHLKPGWRYRGSEPQGEPVGDADATGRYSRPGAPGSDGEESSMSDYTPTTEHIRSLWILGNGGLKPLEQAAEQFDRWLAAHDAEVRSKAFQDAALSARWATKERGSA